MNYERQATFFLTLWLYFVSKIVATKTQLEFLLNCRICEILPRHLRDFNILVVHWVVL